MECSLHNSYFLNVNPHTGTSDSCLKWRSCVPEATRPYKNPTGFGPTAQRKNTDKMAAEKCSSINVKSE